nr:unnamed protein product [Callosobruchus analis]
MHREEDNVICDINLMPKSTIIRRKITKEWAKRFRMGQEFLEDDKRPGRPVEVIPEDQVALVEELVQERQQNQIKNSIKTRAIK